MNVSREQYDVIVVGVGGMGSAAVYRLAGMAMLGETIIATSGQNVLERTTRISNEGAVLAAGT